MGALADQLTRMMMTGAERAIWDLAHEVLERARRDAPPSPPPGEDPSSLSLREAGSSTRAAAARSFSSATSSPPHASCRA
jgi:hypothetical protein